MDIISTGDKISCNAAITLGNFDGLHLGHVKLINELKQQALRFNLKTIVYILEKPYNLETKRILTKEQKIDILNTVGIDYVYFQDFTKDFSSITPEEFIQHILINDLNVKLIVVGDDYRFGHNKKGDVSYLKQMCDASDFAVYSIDKIDGISSTNIRNLIQKGDIKRANQLLGRPFCLKGSVVEGLKIGRTIGFRTANLDVCQGLVLPANGVYKTITKYNNKTYKSITNVGNNPTISNLTYKSVETNIFGFNQDIYGENIEVEFLRKLRGEKKFKDVNELIAQIEHDVKLCQQ